MASEKEVNAILFDQLTILERIENAFESGGEAAAKDMINTIKNEVNRKLYQNPPLTENSQNHG